MVREEIISEEYGDLILTYYGDTRILDRFPTGTVSNINYIYAMVSIPAIEITNDIIDRLGYGAIPNIYGLASTESLQASGIDRIRNIATLNLRGNGVLIGIVDTGIDYTNPIFQYADGTTRIVAIWDQTIQTGNQPEGLFYGSEYLRDEINEALRTEDPFDLVPTRDENGHGTMLAGIAGGSPVVESDFSGVAPDVEFIVVKLKPAKGINREIFFVPENVLCYQETDIIFGIDYLLRQRDQLGRPMSICLAIGSSQGAHDGRGVTPRYLSIISNRAGLACNVAAGNEGNARRHYRGIVDRNIGYDLVELNVGENEGNFAMELWGEAPSILSIDIQSPSGESISKINVVGNEFREIRFVFEETIIYLDFQLVERRSGKQLILFRFANPTQGIWQIRVYEEGDLNLYFNIWLPMEGFISENTFFIKSDPYITILDLGNATYPITITAYNHVDESLYINASRGYSTIGAVKPELAAPGVSVTGPTLNQSFTEFTGTSVSVAHTSGISALLLEWGVIRENLTNMNSIEIKKLLIRGARRDADRVYPNRDWGYGIIDIYNVFDRLRAELES